MEQHEHYFECPYCGASISMLLDPSITKQQYIEDCEVCCNPIELHLQYDDGELANFSAQSIEQ